MKTAYLYIIFAMLTVCFLGEMHPAAAGNGDIQIHGFISQGYLKTDHNNFLADTEDGTFQFNEMGLNFVTYATSRLKIGTQFFARDLGDVGNDEIVVNWAFAEYNYKNWLGLRAGIIKNSSSLYNDIRDYDSLRTCILLPLSSYNELIRDSMDKFKGIQPFGNISLNKFGMLKYALSIGGSNVDKNSGTVQYLKILRGIDEIDEFKVSEPIYGGDIQWFTPLDGLRIGASYLFYEFEFQGSIGTTPVSYKSHSTQIFNFCGEYTLGNFIFTAELNAMKTDEEMRINKGDPIPQDRESWKSFYVQSTYRFTDWFETGFYYSQYYRDPDLRADKDHLRDKCLSLRFDLNPFWVIKLETHLMNGKYAVLPDSNGHTYEEWMVYAAKLSYSF